MQKRAINTRNKTPKKYSRLSSRRHRKYKVPMTFLVYVSIKLKLQTCLRRHRKEKEKLEKEKFPVNPNNMQKLRD